MLCLIFFFKLKFYETTQARHSESGRMSTDIVCIGAIVMIAHSRHTRYYNARTYTFYKDGKVIGSLKFDLRFSEEFYIEEV